MPRWNERARPIRDRQFLEQGFRRQVSLFEKRDMLLQRYGQMVTDALRQGLRVITLHAFAAFSTSGPPGAKNIRGTMLQIIVP